jgi:hypothetical protein
VQVVYNKAGKMFLANNPHQAGEAPVMQAPKSANRVLAVFYIDQERNLEGVKIC